MKQSGSQLIKIELPRTGAIRFIRDVIRDDEGKVIDAKHSIYPPTEAPKTSVSELSEAFPGVRFFCEKQEA